MENLFPFALDTFKKQNFSQLVGEELTEFETGSAEIALLIKDKHKQQHGFVHSPTISYLADNCLTFPGICIRRSAYR